ncbi:MAG TPA: hypothetical protein VMI31_10780 [Fimbriimonadaceae bacterium]|nr:hypothetical protein [Fimbriimonadaceae bacterium]
MALRKLDEIKRAADALTNEEQLDLAQYLIRHVRDSASQKEPRVSDRLDEMAAQARKEHREGRTRKFPE